jgi:5'-3' exonuclease
MGILNFHNWLKDNYTSCFSPCNSKSVYDYIYIDVNHLLHSSLSGTTTEESFVAKLYKSLDQLFCNFIATKKIVLAVDGTPPYSKIILQRTRRQQISSNTANNTSNNTSNNITTLHLTPGTEFMIKVDKYLQDYANMLKKKYLYAKPDIVCIPTTNPGEGEIKIYKKMLEYTKNKNDNSTHLIIGNDADLIVLSMAVIPITNIYMLFRHQKNVELLSIKKLIDIHNNKLEKNVLLIQDNHRWRTDFTLLSFLMGNDYLPKLNFIKFGNLWDSYYTAIKCFNKDSILQQTKEIKYNHKFLTELFIIIVCNLSKAYQKLDLDTSTSLDSKNQIENYLEGLLWCASMYKTGVCPMYNYMYKYKSSPTPMGILNYLLMSTSVTNIRVPKSKINPINSEIFPLMVIPKKSKVLISKKYYDLIDNELVDMYEIEDCTKCKDLKTTQSASYKRLKSNKNKELETSIKNKIKLANFEFTTHKKQHVNTFSIKDIQKIISLTKSI